MHYANRLHQLLITIYVVLASIVIGWLLLHALPAMNQALKTFPWDTADDWFGARYFLMGRNPFAPEVLPELKSAYHLNGMGHPPTAQLWFLPLTRLDLQSMSWVVSHIMLILLLFHILVVVLELRLPAPLVTVALLFSAVLASSWMLDHLAMAQTSEAIALCYALGWYFLRQERQTSAGVALGLATTFKLFPGLMVLFLLVTRRYRAVLAASVTYLTVASVMTAGYGPIAWRQYFQRQSYIADLWVSNIRNGSIHGIVLRLFEPACRQPGPTLFRATAIASGISLVLLGTAWWLSRRAASSARTVDLPYALFCMISGFINPWTWEHYNVILILPLILSGVALWLATRQGLSQSAVLLGCATLVSAIAMLGIDVMAKVRLSRAVHLDPSLHLRLHLLEVASWLPTVLVLVMLGMLIYWFERRRAWPQVFAVAASHPPVAIRES
jgi:hypothetical protein